MNKIKVDKRGVFWKNIGSSGWYFPAARRSWVKLPDLFGALCAQYGLCVRGPYRFARGEIRCAVVPLEQTVAAAEGDGQVAGSGKKACSRCCSCSQVRWGAALWQSSISCASCCGSLSRLVRVYAK